MIIVQAQAMGMCFGVEDALALADGVDEPQSTTILGEIVHNGRVQAHLRQRGFPSQSEQNRTQLPETPAVLITAHGISEHYRQRLQEAGKSLVDTTCPLVTKVHRMAAHLAHKGYRLVLVGKPGHVEVLGITEDHPDALVFPSLASVQGELGARLAVLAQTTTPPDLFEAVLEEVRRRNPQAEVRVADTICRPTRDRQQAIQSLLHRVEALVVVGGANSNNTLRLLEQAQAKGLPCWRVEGPEELRDTWFEGLRVVGLSAGTSTPKASIEAVHRRLLQIARQAAPVAVA